MGCRGTAASQPGKRQSGRSALAGRQRRRGIVGTQVRSAPVAKTPGTAAVGKWTKLAHTARTRIQVARQPVKQSQIRSLSETSDLPDRRAPRASCDEKTRSRCKHRRRVREAPTKQRHHNEWAHVRADARTQPHTRVHLNDHGISPHTRALCARSIAGDTRGNRTPPTHEQRKRGCTCDTRARESDARLPLSHTAPST